MKQSQVDMQTVEAVLGTEGHLAVGALPVDAVLGTEGHPAFGALPVEAVLGNSDP